jgi:hypothetical protein
LADHLVRGKLSEHIVCDPIRYAKRTRERIHLTRVYLVKEGPMSDEVSAGTLKEDESPVDGRARAAGERPDNVLDRSDDGQSASRAEQPSIDAFKGTSLLEAAIAANALSDLERQLLSPASTDDLRSRSYSYGLGELGLEVDSALRSSEYVSPEQRAWLSENPALIAGGIVLGVAYVASSDIALSRTIEKSIELGESASLTLGVNISAGTTRSPGPLQITELSAAFKWSF